MKKLKLHHRIFIGMAAGLIIGLVLHAVGNPQSSGFKTTVWWLNLFGKDIFIGSLKMIIAPLIFTSIVAGISSLPNFKELGSIGITTVMYYVATTTIAVAIGLVAVLIIRPGTKEASQSIRENRVHELTSHREAYSAATGIEDPLAAENRSQYVNWIAEKEGSLMDDRNFGGKWSRIASTTELGPGDMFRRDIIKPILSNPFDALANMRSLGIIFFAILVGVSCMFIGEPAVPVVRFFQAFNQVMMTITLWVMEIAPVAIGCIIASIVATMGIMALQSLGWYCIAVIVGIAAHVVMLLTLVAVIGKMSPLRFLTGIRNAWMIAFSTTSSAATLPVTMQNVTKNLNISPRVANFTLPLGATINMDGTALYEGVAIIFLIQLFGGLDDVPITLTAIKTFIIFITAVLASVGAAAVPSAGLITMAIVAGAVGLPLHYIFFIFAVDHLLDMFRTSTNVMGDAVGAVIVNRLTEAKSGSEKT